MLKMLLETDYVIEQLATELYANDDFYNFTMEDANEKIYITTKSTSEDKDEIYNLLDKKLSSFKKILKDKNVSLKLVEPNKYEIVSDKLNALIERDRGKIAIKLGDFFIMLEKGQIDFIAELRKTEQIISMNNKEYYLYEPPTWELTQKINRYTRYECDGYDIADYLVNKDIKI